MSKHDKHIPVSKRPAMSVAALSGTKSSPDDSLPDLSAPDDAAQDAADAIVNAGDTTDTSDTTDAAGQAEEPSPTLQAPEEAVLFVFEPKCLECSHLVAFAEKAHNGCHFTAGNDDCPAQSVTISVKLPMTKIIRNFLRAEEEGDTEKLGRLYATLSTKPEWAKKQILDALQDARERALVK